MKISTDDKIKKISVKKKKEKLCDWTIEDQLLAYYFYKYSDNHGFINTYWRELPGGYNGDKDFFGRKISRFIGTTYSRFKVMSNNFKYIEKGLDNNLCQNQVLICQEWKDKSRREMEQKMKEIIDNETNICKILIKKNKNKEYGEQKNSR